MIGYDMARDVIGLLVERKRAQISARISISEGECVKNPEWCCTVDIRTPPAKPACCGIKDLVDEVIAAISGPFGSSPFNCEWSFPLTRNADGLSWTGFGEHPGGSGCDGVSMKLTVYCYSDGDGNLTWRAEGWYTTQNGQTVNFGTNLTDGGSLTGGLELPSVPFPGSGTLDIAHPCPGSGGGGGGIDCEDIWITTAPGSGGGGAYSGAAPFSFYLTGTLTAPGGATGSISVNWGDGNVTSGLSFASFSNLNHTFTTNGSYEVVTTVTSGSCVKTYSTMVYVGTFSSLGCIEKSTVTHPGTMPVTIPVGGTATVPVVVSGLDPTANLTRVQYTVIFPVIGHLDVYLEAPNGTIFQLMHNINSGTANCLSKIMDIILEDAATNPVQTSGVGVDPTSTVSGHFYPVNLLSSFNAVPNVNGTWNLIVTDSIGTSVAAQNRVYKVTLCFNGATP